MVWNGKTVPVLVKQTIIFSEAWGDQVFSAVPSLLFLIFLIFKASM